MATLNVIHKRDVHKYAKDGHVVAYVGRPTPLGNPFAIGRDGTREQVIEKYRDWLAQEYRPKVEAQLAHIRYLMEHHKHVHLSCWCAPQECHASIIIEHLEA